MVLNARMCRRMGGAATHALFSYGREWVERCRHLRQEKSRFKPDQPAQSDSSVKDSPSRRVFEKVRDALERMGFRKQQAAHLIAEVEKMHGPAAEPLPITQVLKEALALS
jgi:Holliday junction resolvasome RuvABC DNA-binding subunit